MTGEKKNVIKIGIITFHNAFNYGAVLQNYALQKFIDISFTDCSVETIDYSSESIKKNYSVRSCFSGNLLLCPVRLFYFLRRKKIFADFLKKYVALSSRSFYKTNIADCKEGYDLYIAGSDQIWNIDLTQNDFSYFLDFADRSRSKISYAASCGMKSEALLNNEKIVELLNGFDKISVREGCLLKSVAKAFPNKESVSHLDPTLLFNSDDWRKISSDRKIKKKYLLVYMITYSKPLLTSAKEIAKKKGLDVICIGVNRHVKGVKFVLPCVEEFLALFENASYTVVNSFHGLAFSIIFNVKFLVDLAYTDGKNSRIENLLEKLSLQGRFFNHDKLNAIDDPINWDKVNDILGSERSRSLSYLDSAISFARKNGDSQ